MPTLKCNSSGQALSPPFAWAGKLSRHTLRAESDQSTTRPGRIRVAGCTAAHRNVYSSKYLYVGKPSIPARDAISFFHLFRFKTSTITSPSQGLLRSVIVTRNSMSSFAGYQKACTCQKGVHVALSHWETEMFPRFWAKFEGFETVHVKLHQAKSTFSMF